MYVGPVTKKLAPIATLVAALAVLAPVAAAKPPKKAVIQEGVGVAGVNLGMTQAQAIGKWGKPDGKCNKSQGLTPAFSSCRWTADKNQLVSITVVGGKIVSIKPFGSLWKTSKGAQASKTTFGQLKKIYKGAKEGNTCALDFGHYIETGSGAKVTQFAGSYRSTDKDTFLYITIYNSKKTSDDHAGVGGRPKSRTCNTGTQQPGGGGTTPGGGDTTPTATTYIVSGRTSGSGFGSIAASSGSEGADCSRSSCIVKPGSSVTLTATVESGSNFTGWSGDCSGTATTVTIDNVQGDKSCIATFEDTTV
jgi:hypothetical protein